MFKLLLARVLAAAVAEGESDDGTPNAHVVTVQVGANDGQQNDPFHQALVLGKGITRRTLWVCVWVQVGEGEGGCESVPVWVSG